MSVALGIPPRFLCVDLHQVLVMRPCWTLAPWSFRSDAAGSRQGGMPPEEDEPITTGRYGEGVPPTMPGPDRVVKSTEGTEP